MSTGFKFHIIQRGCVSNESDGLGIKSCLLNYGCIIADKVENSDVVIVMTCGFSKKQFNESIECVLDIANRKRKDARIWVGGCVPAINSNILKNQPVDIDMYFTPRTFKKVLENFLKSQLDFMPTCQLDHKSNKYPIRIINGCTENCTYCVIKRAGGNALSKPIEVILEEIKHLSDNVNEIELAGEEIGAYGKDLNEPLTLLELINKILALRPSTTISLTAIHPRYFIQEFDMYVELYKNSNIIRTLPIPIQSGSDAILKKMNRRYTIDSVTEHINRFLKIHPDVKISTDVIVGFSGETWEDFLLTKSLIEKLPLSALDCFKFDDMKGQGDTVSEDEKIKRLKIIALIFAHKFFISNDIKNYDNFSAFVQTNRIPLNINL